jgi:anaerobic selenocysteine-containing dehydrogenase
MTQHERITYCQICEALCGLVATVEDDRLIQLRPDAEHPMSKGYCCPKGIAMTEIQNDPERVLHPMRRVGPRRFERTTWDAALDEIAERLQTLQVRYGPAALGQYLGVPASFALGHLTWARGFLDQFGSPHAYGAVSQDIGSRLAACNLLFGNPFSAPIPDLARTEFLLIIGANPHVSNGSFLTAPRVKDRLAAIRKRGGRVVVVDPRRTETAKAFEHVAVRPDTDAWLLAGMLAVIFADGITAVNRLSVGVSGLAELQAQTARFTPELCAAATGVAAETIVGLARDFANAGSAVAYGRTGACRGRFGTLVSFLIDALNTVTGNLDRPGGALFTQTAIPVRAMGRAAKLDLVGRFRSTEGGLPDLMGELPTALLARQITTPGPKQIRALWVSAGNPVATVPNSAELISALGQLDLFVSHDLYINDTNCDADFILPAQTWLERQETPFIHAPNHTSPFVQYSQRVVPAYGEARSEWEVMADLGRRLHVVPSGVRAVRILSRLGVQLTPRRLIDLGLRIGPYGDWFGFRRSGLSLRRLERDHPHGVRLAEHHRTGVAPRHVRHPRRRVHLCPAEIISELERLVAAGQAADPRFPLRLVSLRELRSHNSWTHNSPLLMRNRRFAAHVHPDDAAAAGLAEGSRARLSSQTGSVDVEVTLSGDLMAGTIAMPWGWGHHGGWTTANESGGANINLLTSSALEDLEPISGMSWLNGVPVRLERATQHRVTPAVASRAEPTIT